MQSGDYSQNHSITRAKKNNEFSLGKTNFSAQSLFMRSRWGLNLLLFVMLAPPSIPGQGRVVFQGEVFSQILNTNRTIRIYLPPSYESAPRRRFPVLYVHDGQNA